MNPGEAMSLQHGSAITYREMTMADLPRLPIVHAPPVYAAKKALTGWVPNPTGGESFAGITVQK